VKEKLDVLKQGSGAEVPIPVLTDVEIVEATPTALGNVTNTVLRPPLPTISVTKPPAPLPVSLPTPFEIATSPLHPSLDMDLEAGHSLSMREISYEQETTSASPLRSSQPFIGHENAATDLGSPSRIPLPKSPAPVPALDLTDHPSPPPAPAAPVTNIHDFLADSDPLLETTPIQPTSPAPGKHLQLPPAEQKLSNQLENPQETSSIVTDDGVGDDTISDPNQDVTIRLVGGGGTAGTTAALLPDDDMHVNGEGEPDIGGVAGTSVVSGVVDGDPSTKDEKKPEQKKSGMSGLRKLGHLSGLRKNDPSSSLKDIV